MSHFLCIRPFVRLSFRDRFLNLSLKYLLTDFIAKEFPKETEIRIENSINGTSAMAAAAET